MDSEDDRSSVCSNESFLSQDSIVDEEDRQLSHSEYSGGYQSSGIPLQRIENESFASASAPELRSSENELISQRYSAYREILSESSPLLPPRTTSTAIFNRSQNIRVGNRTFVNGPVTIEQLHKKNSKTSSWKKKLSSPYWILIGAFVTLGILISIGVFLFSEEPYDKDEESRVIEPADTDIDGDRIPTGPVLRIVSRSDWVAEAPSVDEVDLKLPVDRVIIAHTATENCTFQMACVFRVKTIQEFHRHSRNFSDIGYNWLIGGDGAVYEGRGWDKQGRHTLRNNENSIGVAFIGTFMHYVPNERQLDEFHLLMEDGVKRGKLKENYRLYGARQFRPTESPGEKLYDIIKTWKHWKEVTK